MVKPRSMRLRHNFSPIPAKGIGYNDCPRGWIGPGMDRLGRKVRAVKSFIVFSFLLLGVVFYEVSGGADFEPETRESAAVEVDETTELALVEETTERTGQSIRERLSIALVAPQVDQDTLEPAAADVDTADPAAPVAEEDAAAVIAATFLTAIEEEVAQAPVQSTAEILSDLRQVSASRVNMRSGPGTNYGVLVTLTSGTTAEVIEESFDTSGDAWVLVRVRDTGQEGWMAARLMTPAGG